MKRRRRARKRNPGGVGGADVLGALAGFGASFGLSRLAGKGFIPPGLSGVVAGVPAMALGGLVAFKEGLSNPTVMRGVGVGGMAFSLFTFFVPPQASAAPTATSTSAASQTAAGNALLAQAQAMKVPATSTVQPVAQPVAVDTNLAEGT